MVGLVRISTGKAIQRRGPGDSENRRTLKIEICCPHPLPKNAVTRGMSAQMPTDTEFAASAFAMKPSGVRTDRYLRRLCLFHTCPPEGLARLPKHTSCL